MKLTVNSKETEVKDGCTIAELSTFLALPEKRYRHSGKQPDGSPYRVGEMCVTPQ